MAGLQTPQRKRKAAVPNLANLRFSLLRPEAVKRREGDQGKRATELRFGRLIGLSMNGHDGTAGAKAAGMSMPPSVVLIYGQARGGTPVMQADPAALDLPLRVLIREDNNGDTLIAFHPIQQTLARYKIPGELAERLAKAQQLLVNSI